MKQHLDEQKAQQKAESKKALDTVVGFFGRPENHDSKRLVVQLPISANAKAIGEVLNHVKTKDKDKSVYLFAADVEEGKVIHGCHVSEVSTAIYRMRCQIS